MGVDLEDVTYMARDRKSELLLLSRLFFSLLATLFYIFVFLLYASSIVAAIGEA